MIADPNPTLGGAGSGPAGGARTAGVFMVAIDPAHFGAAGEYRAMVTNTMNAVKKVRAADGVGEVLVPGEPEVRIRETRRRDGIAIPEPTRQELAEVGDRFGVRLPECQAS